MAYIAITEHATSAEVVEYPEVGFRVLRVRFAGGTDLAIHFTETSDLQMIADACVEGVR